MEVKCNFAEKNLKHELMILDLNGKIVSKSIVFPQTTQEKINFTKSNFSKGFYIVELQNNKEKITSKFWME